MKASDFENHCLRYICAIVDGFCTLQISEEEEVCKEWHVESVVFSVALSGSVCVSTPRQQIIAKIHALRATVHFFDQSLCDSIQIARNKKTFLQIKKTMISEIE